MFLFHRIGLRQKPSLKPNFSSARRAGVFHALRGGSWSLMTEKWTALAREAALAAEHMAIGVTALGKADYVRIAHYSQAFFALSIGLERSAKLALVVDHAVTNTGSFPTNDAIRGYGHNLKGLLQSVDQLAERNSLALRLPTTPIHTQIVDILSEFASNITRYYNLDLLTNAPMVQTRTDPIQRWHDDVVSIVLNEHYKQRRRERDESHAKEVDRIYGAHSFVMMTAENKKDLNSLYEAALQSSRMEFAKPYVRLSVLQVIRFVSGVLSDLGNRAQSQGLMDVPVLSEFFVAFSASDRYLKSRKTWSIYLG